MTQKVARPAPLAEYLGQFDKLIGDKRTGETFREIVRGIINAGSLVCQRIAAQYPLYSAAKDGAQRLIRLAKVESTKHSNLDATHLVQALCERGVAHRAESETDELWLIADPSNLRKPYAQEMADRMEVQNLDGKLVPGYRTLNASGVTPGRRGILYHRLFQCRGGLCQRGQKKVSLSIVPLRESRAVSWSVDRAFDDVAVWRTIWEQEERVVCRIRHRERLVEDQDQDGQWKERDVEAAQQHLRPMASAQAEMMVHRGRQTKARRQRVTAEIRSCPLRLTYDTHVRREGKEEEVEKVIWLVEVKVPRASWLAWAAG